MIVDLEDDAADSVDTLKNAWVATSTPLSTSGDLWVSGWHRLLGGDASRNVTAGSNRHHYTIRPSILLEDVSYPTYVV